MGAMTIVEIIDAHDGFQIITKRITTNSKRKLLWIISLLTFFLSPVLDNLTTTIVMVSLLQKLVDETEERFYFVGMIVIAANAGGAWSPIGDVTTTILWMGGQVTAGNIILKLLLPSIVCLVVPLIILSVKIKGNIRENADEILDTASPAVQVSTRHQGIVFFSGLSMLVSVPVFKTLTHCHHTWAS
jgi:Na+/H+ antiporter NhaD/arsenite permease-like protein